MQHDRKQTLIKLLLSIVILGYSLVMPLVDLNSTHLFHPDWSLHSRLHLVWSVTSFTLMGWYCFFLLWFSDMSFNIRANVVTAICLAINIGFLISAVTRPLYGGELADEIIGVPDLLGDYDANLIFVCFAVCIVFLAIWLQRRKSVG
jgi:hypothetical protein